MQGKFKDRKLNILIDSGSTHSFIDGCLIKKLELVAEVDLPLMVTLADGSRQLVDSICKRVVYEIQCQKLLTDMRPFNLGGSDVILGVDWLKTHSPVTFDFNNCNISLLKEGNQVKLQGITSSGNLQFISGKSLSKLMKSQKGITQGCICMVAATRIEESNVGNTAQKLELTALLQKYQTVLKNQKGFLQKGIRIIKYL